MNQYGRIAQEHWTRHAPRRVENLENAEEFFETLGSQVEAAVIELQLELEGPDSPDEETLEKVQRLQAARQQAEEIVLRELVWLEHEEPATELEQLRQLFTEVFWDLGMTSPRIEERMQETREEQAREAWQERRERRERALSERWSREVNLDEATWEEAWEEMGKPLLPLEPEEQQLLELAGLTKELREAAIGNNPAQTPVWDWEWNLSPEQATHFLTKLKWWLGPTQPLAREQVFVELREAYHEHVQWVEGAQVDLGLS